MMGYMPRVYDASDHRIVKRGYTPKVNKYPGTCVCCGEKVKAGEGATFRAYGKWQVVCAKDKAVALY